MRRVGGIIEFKTNGQMHAAKGEFTYNLGRPKREAVVGSDTTHGYKEEPQPAFIEGAITDKQDTNLDDLLNLTDATVTLSLANGKVVVLRDGFYAADGNATTNEGEVEVRIESATGDAEQVR